MISNGQKMPPVSDTHTTGSNIATRSREAVKLRQADLCERHPGTRTGVGMGTATRLSNNGYLTIFNIGLSVLQM